MAELAAHRSATTPLVVALLGGAGCGKSDALRRLAAQTERLGARAEGSFVGPVACLQIDALALRGDADAALAEACYGQLRAGGHSALAELAGEALADPHRGVAELGDLLDQSRRNLSAQNAALAEIAAKRERLPEDLLGDAPGSALDSYARANRGAIEPRLRSFGFGGDPVSNFKDLVRDLSGGIGLPAYLHAVFGFKSQRGRLTWAVIALLAFAASGYAQAVKPQWLDFLLTALPSDSPVVPWIATHDYLLGWIKYAALLAAAALLATNLGRAFRFMQPLRRGVKLLAEDIAAKRAEIDAEFARQERRVQEAQREAAGRERALLAAERRQAEAGGGAHLPATLIGEAAPAALARNFFAALAEHAGAGKAAARRIFVAIDHLDAVSPARAGEIAQAVAANLLRPGFVVALALDPASAAARGVERLADVALRLDGGLAPGQAGSMTLDLLGHREGAPRAERPQSAPGVSLLDRPISLVEAKWLTDLAPLAGRTPRRLKRFIEHYRLARASQPNYDASLALALAVQNGGTAQEIELFRAAAAGKGAMEDFDLGMASRHLGDLVVGARIANGARLTAGQMQAALATAAGFGWPEH